MKKEYKVEGIEALNPKGWGGMVSRSIAIKAEADISKGIDTIATTEAPAEVIDWERYQIVREILPMRYMEAPNNDKVPLLDSHRRESVEKVKGSAQGFRAEGINLMCKTFISASDPILIQKVNEGHIDSVSIGYTTDKNYTVEVPKNASVMIDGVAYKNEYEDGIPLLVRTWWKVKELSLVPIGADQDAKFKEEPEYKALVSKLETLEREIAEIKTPKTKSMSYMEYRLRMINHY